MANIYVGFHDQRSSSRVLKPPGGGTSDIFGTDPVKVNKEENRSVPTTPVKENVDVTNQEAPEHKSDSVDNSKQEEISNSEGPNIENLSIHEKSDGKSTDDTTEAKGEAKPDTIGNIIRQNEVVHTPAADTEKKTPQRVPPGGYSSGLW